MSERNTTIWPGWETVRLIGRGSFGAVYEIERDVFGDIEKAALKVITIPQNASDIDEMYSDGYDDESITSTFRSHLKSIVAEYSLMRKMNGCANIVNCDDIRYVQHDDGIGWDIFIKMELLTPLTKALPADIPEKTVIQIAKDMCVALQLCKEHGIVHRDIKPQNIFVSSHGDYKLGDFGVAKTVEKTMGGTKIGTYKYMAPEVYNNQPYGSGADIYSLGLVLYWLLNDRRLPFLPLPPAKLSTGMEEEARHRRFSGEAIPAPKNGSERLKAIVLKACAFDPKDRYQSAEEMLAELEAINNHTPIAPDVRPAPVVMEHEKVDDDRTVGPAWEKRDELPPEETEGTIGPVFTKPEPKPVPATNPKPQPAKKKKKIWPLLVAGLAAIVLIVAVLLLWNFDENQKQDENNPTNVETTEKPVEEPDGLNYDGSSVTITFYHTMGNRLSSVLDKYIEGFNAMYPNITIIPSSVGTWDNLYSQISSELADGNQPNLAYCYPEHVAHYNIINGVVALDPYINSQTVITCGDGSRQVLGLTQEQKENFVDGLLEEGCQFGDGLTYSMPLSKTTQLLFYNKSFFENLQLPVPSTWEEMEAVCEMIREIDPTAIPLAIDDESALFITLCKQYNAPYTSATGEHYLFDNDTNRRNLVMLRRWYQSGYVTTKQICGSYASELFTSTTGTRCYMAIGSSGASSHYTVRMPDGSYAFEVGIAAIPQANAVATGSIAKGPSLCVFQSENAQEIVASWLFVKFLATNEAFQCEFSMVSGYMPVIKSVTQDEMFADFLSSADGGRNVANLSIKTCLEQIDRFYGIPAFNGMQTASEQVGILLANCMACETGEDTETIIKKAFEEAIKQCG